jgi:hypothetical protein
MENCKECIWKMSVLYLNAWLHSFFTIIKHWSPAECQSTVKPQLRLKKYYDPTHIRISKRQT